MLRRFYYYYSMYGSIVVGGWALSIFPFLVGAESRKILLHNHLPSIVVGVHTPTYLPQDKGDFVLSPSQRIKYVLPPPTIDWPTKAHWRVSSPCLVIQEANKGMAVWKEPFTSDKLEDK